MVVGASPVMCVSAEDNGRNFKFRPGSVLLFFRFYTWMARLSRFFDDMTSYDACVPRSASFEQ